MDPITHAASGALAMLAMPSRPSTRYAVPLAALAAAAPDLDVILGWSPLLALQTHRGFTHALAFAPIWGLILALLMFPLWRHKKPLAVQQTHIHLWSFPLTWLFATSMILLHIWLDAVTSYGTQIFLPFSDMRIRANAIFIIDPFLTIPLLLALLWRHKKNFITVAMLWVFFYPASMIAVHEWHSIQANTALRRAENYVLPDILSPFHWRVLSQKDGIVQAYGMDWRGQLKKVDTVMPAAPSPLLHTLAQQDASCLAFQRFSLLPVLWHEDDGAWLLYDLRFGTSQAWARKFMYALVPQPSPFQLHVRLQPNGTIHAVRMQYSARDSGWQKPHPPQHKPIYTALGLY